MITPIGTLNINQIAERKDDLLVSSDDIKRVAKNERNKALDEFAEALKERLVGMQMAELQGEDVCPCAETGEDCLYMNQDIGCQYCAREQTIKDVDEIAETLKGVQYDYQKSG